MVNGVALALAFQKHAFAWKPSGNQPYKVINKSIWSIQKIACL